MKTTQAAGPSSVNRHAARARGGRGTSPPQVASAKWCRCFTERAKRDVPRLALSVDRDLLGLASACRHRGCGRGRIRHLHLGLAGRQGGVVLAELFLQRPRLDGVELAAIKGLNDKLEKAVKEKDVQITELEKRLDKLESLLRSQSNRN